METIGGILNERDCGTSLLLLLPLSCSRLLIWIIWDGMVRIIFRFILHWSIGLIKVERDVATPAKFSMRKEQDIMQGMIEWTEFTDVHIATCPLPENNIPWIHWYVFITWQDESQLI